MTKPLTGKKVNCKGCAILIYKPLSRLRFNSYWCSCSCRRGSGFNFPCLICKSKIFTQPSQLKLRARSTCSPDCRRILRKQQAKENRIKIGMTKHQIDRSLRYSIEAVEWRKNVFKRDNYTCQLCAIRGTYLEADHIKPWAYFPELRFVLSNGRTLCKSCHNKTKISAKAMKEKYDNR